MFSTTLVRGGCDKTAQDVASAVDAILEISSLMHSYAVTLLTSAVVLRETFAPGVAVPVEKLLRQTEDLADWSELLTKRARGLQAVLEKLAGGR